MISESVQKMAKEFGVPLDAIEQETARLYEWIEEYNLQEIRKELDLTQEQVAERLGVGQGRVSDIERGKVSSLRVDTLARYADALDCDMRIVYSPRNSNLPPARIAVG